MKSLPVSGHKQNLGIVAAACRVGQNDPSAGGGSALAALGQPGGQPLEHEPGDQAGHVAAEGRDLLDQRGREEGPLGAGGHEDRLDGRQRGVHLGHLELVVEVADRAQALDDRVHVVGQAEVGEQAGEAVDADVVPARAGLLEHGDALLGGEEPVLGGVDAHGDDDLVEEAWRPARRCRGGRW